MVSHDYDSSIKMTSKRIYDGDMLYFRTVNFDQQEGYSLHSILDWMLS